ncbi:MAG TPA: hypothetical protein DIW15_00055 [Bavariicoccus seileri]|uniref:Cation efflux protein transmembrane domain-containing protein n=1 Tax=Bavariicoccus seileri TaxID=549685 RepID=A0A3D4S3C5_9ENTE|nr:hypothetical protein [Bavariicoccus seileri]
MSQKRRERKGLLIGIVINLIMGVAGVWVYELTKIQALFVDAYFTIIALVSGVAAIIISRVSPRKTKRFPQGLFFSRTFVCSAEILIVNCVISKFSHICH